MTEQTAPTLPSLYQQDETGWLEQTAELVAQQRFAEIDSRELSEYLADIARRDKREVLSRLVVLLAHLLKWRCAHFRPGLTQSGNWRTPVAGDAKGFPDLVLCRDRVLFVELKSDRGRLSPDQQDWLHALGEAGAGRHVWYPRDWSDGTIERELRKTAVGSLKAQWPA